MRPILCGILKNSAVGDTISSMEKTKARAGKTGKDRNLRSLVLLLEDEEPSSASLVREHILKIGAPILPYLMDLERSRPALFEKAKGLISDIVFGEIKKEFEKFARLSESKKDLEKGAFLIARFAYPLLDERVYHKWLDNIAEKIKSDISSSENSTTAFKRLHSFLSNAMGFRVNEENYYDPDNNYLNRVIEMRRGTPLSLSILFLILARRLKIPAFGIGLPGHFVVGLGRPSLFWDPILNKTLDVSGMRKRLAQNGFSYDPNALRPVSHSHILMRLLRNLMAVYQNAGLNLNSERLGELAQILLIPQ